MAGIQNMALHQYLGIESILVKCCDEILQPPLRWSAQILEGRVKIRAVTGIKNGIEYLPSDNRPKFE